MDSPQIIWLFEILESYDKHEKALFLQFVTGSSKIPLDGFKSLQGMDGTDPFKEPGCAAGAAYGPARGTALAPGRGWTQPVCLKIAANYSGKIHPKR